MDEDILMQRAANGDVAAFGTLVKAHQQRLVRFAGRMLTDREQAEDVVQEAFVRLWRARMHYRLQGQLGCYLLRIVRNICLDIRRSAHPSASLKEAVEVDLGLGARQLAVVDQTTPRREKLQTRFIGRGADGIEYGGDTATSRVCANRLCHISRSAIDDMVRAGCARIGHPLTAGDSDPIHSAIGQNCNKHSAYRSCRSPDCG